MWWHLLLPQRSDSLNKCFDTVVFIAIADDFVMETMLPN